MWNLEAGILKLEKKTLAFLIAGVLLLFDQAVKYIFSDSSGFYCNPVGPWGISVDNEVLVVVMIAVLLVVGYLFLTGFLRDSSTSLGMTACGGASCHMAFALVFVGGVSNLLDRILFGCVRDFSLIPWFPAFNLADVFLTIGAGLLLFSMLRKK